MESGVVLVSVMVMSVLSVGILNLNRVVGARIEQVVEVEMRSYVDIRRSLAAMCKAVVCVYHRGGGSRC